MRLLYLALSALLISCLACSKDNSLDNEDAAVKKLPGTIYWSFSGDVGYLDFSSGKFTMRMMSVGPGSSNLDSYDISWDNKKTLVALDVEGAFNFDERRFVMRNKADRFNSSDIRDGNNLFDITYEWDHIGITEAHISPNEKYIALDAQHFAEMPMTIIDAKTGEYVSAWRVKGLSYLEYSSPIWTADNTLYCRMGNSVYVCSPNDGYQSIKNVLTMKGIGYLTVNPQGTKFAFRKNKHIWMCDIDGSNLQQITTGYTSDIISYDGESSPTFSPDGKYIAFSGSTRNGTPWSDHDYADGSWVASVGGKYGYIIIVPADGKLYDLDQKDGGSIFLKKPDQDYTGIPTSGRLIWR
ncbi:TolB family protein [Sphingobacterium lactis]|uniref:TolB family protein n=1 Tax=Sphingobacterium lactis TaxID=797291 RepID=UPI003F822F89